MAIATINPTTGETIKTFDALTGAELDDKLERASAAFRSYRLTSAEDRVGWLNAAADVLERDVDEVGELMTLEMGKTLAAAKAEAQKCAKALRYYAKHGPAFLDPTPADAGAVGAERAFIAYQPIGVVLAIMPWNFPLWQAMRFAAPALMAGNVGLLKHASNVPQTALYMEHLFRTAGFPDDVFQTLLIGSKDVETVLRDDRVAAATLTGSGPAGQSVASIAGNVLKKTVLELGGSDPFVVMPSADLDKAAEVAVVARCQNNGQSCIAAKRFIVHEAVADEFERLFAEKLQALAVGDPMKDDTKVGPLATESGREDVEELVQDAAAKGARIVTGGTRLDGPGFFYPPTLVTDITPEMRIYAEEVFGPVASLYRVPDLEAAIALANDSEFGLGSNIWTDDEDERERFVRDVEAGMVFVNGMTTSYPELPFGGVKTSGYGRELTELGMREFMNIKSVWVGAGSSTGSTGAGSAKTE
ncbi:MAG: succinate-semialdehyde dehydrogenase / glutarate-semialdehyde dehydrogenase [Pseudonocardiales bacterium]|nr:succinate-semialdehyde dehydrogenase / glutarate-semialdehyde dehydrogenase [Pseudonocardiales bacterium]